jgi:hypothetical protein
MKARTPKTSIPSTNKDGHVTAPSLRVWRERLSLILDRRTPVLKRMDTAKIDPMTMNRACMHAKLKPNAIELLRRSRRRTCVSALDEPAGLLKETIVQW